MGIAHVRGKVHEFFLVPTLAAPAMMDCCMVYDTVCWHAFTLVLLNFVPPTSAQHCWEVWATGLLNISGVHLCHCYAMATEPYKVTLLTDLPEAMQRPHSMEPFHAFAAFATDGP